MRHGPTKHDILNKHKLNKIIEEIGDVLNEYSQGKIDQVISSPVERCVETAKIIMDHMDIDPIKFKIKDKLSRIRHSEPKSECHERGNRFGKKIHRKISKNNQNILIITHSSILKSVIEGIIDKPLEYTRLHKASLSVYNCDTSSLEVFNKKFKQ